MPKLLGTTCRDPLACSPSATRPRPPCAITPSRSSADLLHPRALGEHVDEPRHCVRDTEQREEHDELLLTRARLTRTRNLHRSSTENSLISSSWPPAPAPCAPVRRPLSQRSSPNRLRTLPIATWSYPSRSTTPTIAKNDECAATNVLSTICTIACSTFS